MSTEKTKVKLPVMFWVLQSVLIILVLLIMLFTLTTMSYTYSSLDTLTGSGYRKETINSKLNSISDDVSKIKNETRCGDLFDPCYAKLR